MRRFVLLFVALLWFSALMANKPSGKFVKKAAKSIENGNLKLAKNYYKRALKENPNDYEANLGMGALLCELLDNYSEALPFLEKAYQSSVSDTLKDLLFCLAKCYHHNGDYEKAISFYDRLTGCVDYEQEIDFGKELQKRKDDCKYALDHKFYSPAPNIFIVNAGKTINTDMPEYVPVLTSQNELIFTSKRQDNPLEELSYLDGKYFESMYISQMDNVGFRKVRRYTLPDQLLKSHFSKHHESVISLSPDGKKLFTFHDARLYESEMAERTSAKPKELLKELHFNYYQNHAFVTKDGKTLYFTSDAEGGLGGDDIYRSVKNEQGKWSKPINLGEPINTPFDEESPFLSDDGLTLYFASKGHEGFGNFDIYKSYFLDSVWTKPENLGEPINSPGHDVFLISDSLNSVGYFSSSRKGGFGDMDIYKIIYLDKIDKTCPENNSSGISLNITDLDSSDYKTKIAAIIPSNYKVLNYEWRVDGVLIDTLGSNFEYDYLKEGTYDVKSKIVALCDTCIMPVISCIAVKTTFERVKIVSPATPLAVNLDEYRGQLLDGQLKALGFDLSPMLFDFNRSEILPDVDKILSINAKHLQKYPTLSIELIGYSDVRGTETNNQRVSDIRAKNVKKFFIKSGVKKSQVKFAKGLGAQDLVNDCGVGKNCDDEVHRKNRRVIFKVYNN